MTPDEATETLGAQEKTGSCVGPAWDVSTEEEYESTVKCRLGLVGWIITVNFHPDTVVGQKRYYEMYNIM